MQMYFYERALFLIENYIFRLKRPRRYLKLDQFTHRSYTIWAAEELMVYVKKHDTIPPLDAVSAFMNLMDELAVMDEATSYIFSIARDTAQDIFDMLLTAL